MEGMIRLYPEYKDRSDVLEHGGRVFRSEDTDDDFMYIPDDISEENKAYLIEHYGEKGKDSLNVKKEERLIWASVLNDHDTLNILRTIRQYGLPDNDPQLIKMFNIFGRVKRSYLGADIPGDEYSGEYPIDYETLKRYSPEFEKDWGTDKIIELTDKANIFYDGYGINRRIAESSLSDVEKAFLHYIFID